MNFFKNALDFFGNRNKVLKTPEPYQATNKVVNLIEKYGMYIRRERVEFSSRLSNKRRKLPIYTLSL